MVEGRVTFPSKGSVKSNMPLIWQRPFGVIPGAVSFFFFWGGGGPMRSRYVVIMVKFQIFINIISN